MKKQRGFSLIELLIVVAIILIIAAIAIPNLLRSRIAAHEASAVSSIRMINNAEVMFSSAYSSGFTDGLNRLGPPTTAGQQADVNNADILDPILAGRSGTGTNLSFVKNGYIFGYAPTGTWGSIASYQVIADPTLRGSSGQRSFFSNEPLVIRSNALSTATVSDMPI